jgi:hypothetical protein
MIIMSWNAQIEPKILFDEMIFDEQIEYTFLITFFKISTVCVFFTCEMKIVIYGQ